MKKRFVFRQVRNSDSGVRSLGARLGLGLRFQELRSNVHIKTKYISDFYNVKSRTHTRRVDGVDAVL